MDNQSLIILRAYNQATGCKLIVPECIYDLLSDGEKKLVMKYVINECRSAISGMPGSYK